MSTEKKNQVTVLLVDDHAVVREGYRRLLERHGDIAVIGEAADAATAQCPVQLPPQPADRGHGYHAAGHQRHRSHAPHVDLQARHAGADFQHARGCHFREARAPSGGLRLS